MRPLTYEKSANGEISVGGVTLRELAHKYGTPLYLLDYATLVERMRQYREALLTLSPAGQPYYACKAFCCRAMVELVQQQGLGLDVVSGGELTTAMRSGFDAKNILFHGNVKTLRELELGLEVGVGAFVVDSLDELAQLEALAANLHRTAPVLLRLTPGIEAHTHEFIRTGQFDSKFGFATIDGIARHAVQSALQAPHLDLKGFHAHIGSQILDSHPLVENLNALLDFSQAMYHEFHYWPQILDVGGGLGVRYNELDQPPQLQRIVDAMKARLQDLTPTQPPPKILFEPGRSIVAEAGLTLYTVQVVKRVAGGREYVAVDGGMGDNIRPALYQASYTAEMDAKPSDAPSRVVSVAGRYCESGDILIPSQSLADPQVGDLMAIWGTGAYNYAMASTYNRVPRPAVVMARDGCSQILVEGEDWEDLLRYDRPLESMNGVKAL